MSSGFIYFPAPIGIQSGRGLPQSKEPEDGLVK